MQYLMVTAYSQPVRGTPQRETKALLAEPGTAAAGRLRVLCLPGVGYTQSVDGQGCADADWQEQWRRLIRNQLAQNGRAIDDQDIDFLQLDDLLEDGPNFAQITRGLAMLRGDIKGKTDETDRTNPASARADRRV
jgi:hypothetical protein